MAKISKEKSQQIFLIVSATAIALYGVWYFLIAANLTTIRETRKKQEEAELKVKTAQNLATQSDIINRDLAAAQQRLQTIELEMASGDYYIWSFKLMEALMNTNNVKLIDSERPKQNEAGLYARFPYKAISFAVRASGYYHDIGAFLREFENRFPYMQCRNLSLVPETPQAASDREKLSLRFEVIALVQPVRS
jgi:Tfp pilus assembly protein PilO